MAAATLRREGVVLTMDGDLGPLVLDNLLGKEKTAWLKKLVDRAKKGSDDAALLTGSSKDLLEAVAAHVLVQSHGDYNRAGGFPFLLSQAFNTLGLATQAPNPSSGGDGRRSTPVG